MEVCRQRSLQPGKLWVWFLMAVAAVSLALVTVLSLGRGPSAQHAALVISKAQHDIAMARRTASGSQPLAFREAEVALSSAHAALAARQYEAAVTTATRASQVAKEILGRPPPRPSTATGEDVR